MGESGIFAPDERVELIEGDIIPVSPQNPRHARKISKLNTRFVRLFGDTHEIRVQLPLTLGTHSEPEPDFALVKLETPLPGARHPEMADLVVELADSSLSFDRNAKASLYAKAQISEYWILNLKNQKLEIRTLPAQDTESAYGWSYSSTQVHSLGAKVSPKFAPDVFFEVSELVE